MSFYRSQKAAYILHVVIFMTYCSPKPINNSLSEPRYLPSDEKPTQSNPAPSEKKKIVVDIGSPMVLGSGMGMLLISTVDDEGRHIQSEASLDDDYLGNVFSSNTFAPFLTDQLGEKTLQLSSPGYYPVSHRIDIAEGRLTSVSATMKEARLTEGTGDIEWIFIKGDIFKMGEKPHARRFVPSFEIMRSEVTVRQYEACSNAGICALIPDKEYSSDCNFHNLERSRHPINCVEFVNASSYCRAIGGRLPTEAEWEFAARSGNNKKLYPWGDISPSCNVAVMFEESFGCRENHTWPVCSKPAGNTEQGLCDMAGNVSEWTSNIYNGRFYSSLDEETYVIRGGSWSDFGADKLRTSVQESAIARTRETSIGFRCVRDLKKAGSNPNTEHKSLLVGLSEYSDSWEVVDPHSGRFWLKCAAGQWLDEEGNCVGDKITMYWTEALRVCPKGYRLPTRQEVLDILGNCEESVRIKAKRGNCTQCSQSEVCTIMFPNDIDLYWTSSPLFESYEFSWLVDFGTGEVACMPTTLFAAKARCIRE